MQLIIDIDEETYNEVYWRGLALCPRDNANLVKAIKNGVRLPKTHGRLKDVDAFILKVNADREHSAYVKSWTADDVLSALDNSYVPTIIAADKTESEG